MKVAKRAGGGTALADAPLGAAPMASDAETSPADILTDAMAAARPDAAPIGADALRKLLGRLQAEGETATAKIAELEALETERILDESDEVLDGIAQDILRARRRATRLKKLAERLGELLRQAEDREAEDGRRARYEAAAAAAREIQAWVATGYAEHAAAIGDGLTRLNEAAVAVEAANADRPAGAARIDLEAFRALPAVPDDVRHVPETYYVDDAGTVIGPDVVHQDGRGQYWFGEGHNARAVYARERMRAETIPGRPAVSPRSLAVAVHLPGVKYGETDFWPRRSKLWGA